MKLILKGKVNSNITFYLIYNTLCKILSFRLAINMKIIEIFCITFFILSFQNAACILYLQHAAVQTNTFQVLSRHTCPVATVLHSARRKGLQTQIDQAKAQLFGNIMEFLLCLPLYYKYIGVRNHILYLMHTWVEK